jgi:hypothetical protein
LQNKCLFKSAVVHREENKQTNQKPQTKTRKNPEEKEFKSNICQMPYFSKAIT